MKHTFYSTFPLLLTVQKSMTNLRCTLLALYANVQGANSPYRSVQAYHGDENDNGLSEACKEWIVVGDDQLAITEIIYNIDGCECEGRSTGGIHESSVERSGCADEGNSSAVLNVSRNVSICKRFCINNTYSAPSGRITRSTTCAYSTPSGCFGPSRKGTFRTYPLPVLSFRRYFFKSALHPTRKG
jgi:hypothetical protein